MNHPSKPLASANLHWLLKLGTFFKNNIAQNISNTSPFVPMNCWNLGTKVYVSFYWGGSANNNNNKTLPMRRRRSRRTQPQEGTLIPTTTKQQQWQYCNDFDDKAPKPRCQQQQLYDNNDNVNETLMLTPTMEVIDKILTWAIIITVSKNNSKEWSVEIPY